LDRLEYFRMAARGLLLGLILPALVILGVALGFSIGRELSSFHKMLLALLGGLGGLAVGTLVVVKLIEKMYSS